MYRGIALTLTVIAIVIAFAVSSAIAQVAQEYRLFTGANNNIIEAQFLGFDESAGIVKLRLKDGRDQNVPLALFSREDQEWIRNPPLRTDNPFDVGDGSAFVREGDFEWLFDGRNLSGWEDDTDAYHVDQNQKALVHASKGNMRASKNGRRHAIALVHSGV